MTLTEAYRILDLDMNADIGKVKKAFKEKVKKYHPDNTGNLSKQMQDEYKRCYEKVNEAYHLIVQMIGTDSAFEKQEYAKSGTSYADEKYGYKKRREAEQKNYGEEQRTDEASRARAEKIKREQEVKRQYENEQRRCAEEERKREEEKRKENERRRMQEGAAERVRKEREKSTERIRKEKEKDEAAEHFRKAREEKEAAEQRKKADQNNTVKAPEEALKKDSEKTDDAVNKKPKRRKMIMAMFGCALVAIVVYASIYSYAQYQNRQYEILCVQSKMLEEDQKYQEAISIFDTISDTSNFYMDAQNRISEIKNAYEKNTIEQANELLKEREYEYAYEKVEAVEKDLGARDELEETKRKIDKKILQEVEPQISVNCDVEEFVEGDAISEDDFVVHLFYTERIQKDVLPIALSTDVVENAGENHVLIEWEEGRQVDYVFTAIPRITSIQAEYVGEQLTKGDAIKKSWISVNGICSDNTQRDIKEFELDLYNLPDAGDNIICVTYGEFQCEVIINALPHYTLLKDIKVVKGRKDTMFRTNGEDTLGNTYLDYMFVAYDEYDFDGHGNIIFNLNGEYDHFCTTIAPGTFYDGSMHIGGDYVVVEIWGDGNIIYSTPKFDYTTQPFAIDIQVSGVNVLDIKPQYYGAVFFDSPKLY